MKFKNDIELQAGLEDLSGSTGTLGQILSSTETGTSWIAQDDIISAASKLVVIECKNTYTASILKGTPVYQTGTVGATDVIEVAPADALISLGHQPAVGLLQQDLAINEFGNVVITGELLNFTTDPIDGLTPVTGDKVFVKSGGGLTLTKPTGEGNGIQNMGLVGKVSGGNAGSITVSSIMRTNDVPNLPEGRIWIGDGNTIVSDTVYVDEPNGRMGIGTTGPSEKLDVRDGTITSRDSGNVNYAELDRFAGLTLKGNGAGAKYISTPNTDDLGFKTNNAERMRILANGTILIGSTIDFSDGNADDLQIGNTTGSHGVSIMSQNNAVGSIYFGDNDNNDAGIINYEHGLNQLRFVTNRAQRMVIDSTGNVGIGTVNPTEKLQVYEGGLTAYKTYTATNAGAILTAYQSTFSPFTKTTDLVAGSDSTVPSEIRFLTRTNGTSTIDERMRITSAGNVGIGTTGPSTKLDVAGNANISDTLAIGSLSTVPTASLGRALNIQVLANSSGTTVAQWIDIDRTITTDSTSAATWGMVLRNASTTTSTANDGKMYGAQIIGRHQGTGGIESAMGVRSTADINTTGTITATGTLWGAYNEAQVTNGSVTFANSGIFGTASRGQVLGSGTVNITSQGVVGTVAIGVLNNVNATVNRVVGGEFELDLQNGTTTQAHVVSLNTFNIASPTNLFIDEFAYIYLGEDVAIPTTITDNAYFIKSLTSLPSELAGSIEATSFIKTGGTSSQFLKADGSIDSTSYAPSTGGSYLPLAGGTMTGATLHGDSVMSRYGTGNDFSIYHNGTNGYLQNEVGHLIIPVGNVGIGTTSPGEPLTVKTKTDAYFPGIKVEDYNSTMGLYVQNIEGSNSGIGTGRYYNSGFWRSDVTAPTTIRLDGGAIRFYAQSGVTADVNYVATERMRIDGNGNVGIGTVTTSPYRFNVLRSDGNVAFLTDGATADLAITCIGGVTDLSPTTGVLAFGTSSTERMRINASGNVGIGTTSPGAKLDIVGSTLGLRIKKADLSDVLRVYTQGSGIFMDNGNVHISDDLKIGATLLSNQENTDIDSAASEVVAQVSTTDYTAAFFDFVVKKGTNIRSGTVYACHDGTNVEFTETSTNDLGDTSDVTLSVDISGANMRLLATVTSDDWSVKSLIRAI